LLVLSDLHLEFGHPYPPPRDDADVVVLCGDIHLCDRGIGFARQFAPRPVVYVAGNHEFYIPWANEFYTLDEALLRLRRSAAGTNVSFLENDEATIDGVRFLGCTLWTDFALYGPEDREPAMVRARVAMADYLSIYRAAGARLRPSDTGALHAASARWLQERLDTPCSGPTVVVTHHAPSRRSLARRFEGDPLSPAFASHLDHLLGGDHVRLWIHGHTHHSVDYDAGGTRVLSNQRGYPGEARTGFRDALVAEI
jgi:predicted phosphodiesterase